MVQNLAFGAYLAKQRFGASMCTFIVPCSLYPSFRAIVATRGKVSSVEATMLQHGTTWGMWSCSAALGVLTGAGFCWNLLDPGVSVPLKFGGVLAPGTQSHAPCCYK